MEANPDYLGGAPKIDKYIVRKYDNEEAMATALREGEIDIMSDVSIDVFESLQGVEGITTNVGPLSSFDQMSFPLCQDSTASAGDTDCKNSTTRTGHPALLDQRSVERSLSRSTEKTIVDRVLQGYGAVGTTVIPPFNRWHAEPAEGRSPSIPPKPIGSSMRRVPRHGWRWRARDARGWQCARLPLLSVRSEPRRRSPTGEFISGWLEDIGIATRIEVGHR